MPRYQYRMINSTGKLEPFITGYPDSVTGSENDFGATCLNEAVEKLITYLNQNWARDYPFVVDGNPPARFGDCATTLFSDEGMPRIFLYQAGTPKSVKFIVTDDRIAFGTNPADYDLHTHIAKTNGISREAVRGGGIADLANHRIRGKSEEFGPYDRWMVQRLLPDWRVDPSF